MKVLVTGSRYWPEEDRSIIRMELERLPPKSTIIHGACHLGGADKIAGEEAKKLGHKVIECPVDFKWDGPWPMAGNRRNGRMLKEHHKSTDPIQQVLAFPLPSSGGTWDMISKAQRLKIPVWIYPTGFEEAT